MLFTVQQTNQVADFNYAGISLGFLVFFVGLGLIAWYIISGKSSTLEATSARG